MKILICCSPNRIYNISLNLYFEANLDNKSLKCSEKWKFECLQEGKLPAEEDSVI